MDELKDREITFVAAKQCLLVVLLFEAHLSDLNPLIHVGLLEMSDKQRELQPIEKKTIDRTLDCK